MKTQATPAAREVAAALSTSISDAILEASLDATDRAVSIVGRWDPSEDLPSPVEVADALVARKDFRDALAGVCALAVSRLASSNNADS